MKLYLGIDVGGTKIELVVIDQNFKVLYRERVSTDADENADIVFSKIEGLYLSAVKKFSNYNLSIGIGIPGVISKKNGILSHSTILSHNGLKIKKYYDSIFKKNYAIENDANCFALAESILGAGKKHSTVFGLILGTGTGSGIIFHQEIYNGANNIAGELGHSIIEKNGELCFCGKKGCLNAYISGTGLENLIFKNTKKHISAKSFLSKNNFSKHDKILINTYLDYFTTAISNIILIHDPEVIVIGGGLSNSKILYEDNFDQIFKKLKPFEKLNTKIVKNKLGDSAGVIGAALLGAKIIKN